MPDTVTLTVRFVSSGRYIFRSKGEIVEVQEGDEPTRPPKNGFTDPDAAGRYLEANGYRFVPAESGWLDRIRTTLRPRRKLVFRRVTA